VGYHLGLSYFLQGNYLSALTTYQKLLLDGAQLNDESFVATTHWLYMTLRRLGRDAQANATLLPIHKGMRMLEDGAYLNLTLLYKGELSTEEVRAHAHNQPMFISNNPSNSHTPFKAPSPPSTSLFSLDRHPPQVLPSDLATRSPLDFSTIAFGVANLWYCNGQHQQASALLDKVGTGLRLHVIYHDGHPIDLILTVQVLNQAADYWAAFGYIAAEADQFRRRLV
jgi:hypothetical protein